MCRLTHTHTIALSLYFSSPLLIPLAGLPCLDHPQCLSRLWLGEAKVKWQAAGFVVAPLAAQRAWRKWNNMHFESRTRLGYCCQKFIFTLIVTHFGKHSNFLLLFFLVAKLCPSLSTVPWSYGPQGSSVHEISLARLLTWVAASFSRGSFQPRDWTCVSCIGRWILYHWATRETQYYNFFIHSSVKSNGHAGCSHVLGTLSQAAMNMRVQMAFQVIVVIYFG